MNIRNSALYLFYFILSSLVLSLVLYMFTGMNGIHHHESAYTLFYGKNVLNHGFYSQSFGGREVAILTWAPISAIVQAIYGFNLTAHSITSFLFLLFVLTIGYFVSKNLRSGKFSTVTLLILLVLNFNVKSIPYKWFDQVWLWPMNSYGIYDILSFVLVITTYKYFSLINLGLTKNNKITGLFFDGLSLFMIFFVFSLNGIRGMMIIIIPVLTAYIYYTYVNIECINNNRLKRNVLVFYIASFFGVFSGILVNKIIGFGANNLNQESHTFFSNPDIGFKAIQLIEKWYSLFEAIPIPGEKVISLVGILIVAKFFIATALIFIPIFYRKKLISHSALSAVFYYKFCAIFFIVIFSYIFGSSHQERYLIPVAISSFVLLGIYIDIAIKERNGVFLAFFYSAIFICLISNINFYYVNSYSYLKDPVAYLSKNDSYRLAKFLEGKGLKFGYETKWYRQTLPVNLYGSGDVFLGLIEIDSFAPHFHSDESWFIDRKDVFLIVDQEDFKLNPYIKYLLSRHNPVVYEFEGRKIIAFSNFPRSFIKKTL